METLTRSIDLYVDGSINGDGRGGWGAVLARVDRQLAEFSGALKVNPGSSTLCEARAAVNALHAAITARLIRAGDRVTIWTDNSTAVRLVNREAFKRRSTNSRADYCEIRNRIAGIAEAHEITIDSRWIAGHQSDAAAAQDHRVRFNKLADRLCGIVTGTRKAPAEVARGAEAHRRAVILGQRLKVAAAERAKADRAARTAKLRRDVAAGRLLEGGS